MVDFNHKTLNIGDKLVFLFNERTGSSTFRKCLHRGEVVGFTNCKVRLREEHGWECLIYPCDIIKVNW